MWQAKAGRRTGLQWTFLNQVKDLDYAEDINLVFHKQQNAQEKPSRIAEEAEKTGLQINIGKTGVMKVNNRLHQKDIKEGDKLLLTNCLQI